MKLPDIEMRELKDPGLLDFIDYVRIILNGGRYQSRVVTSAPDWTGQNGDFVFYKAGNDRRIYFYVDDTWVYIGFTTTETTGESLGGDLSGTVSAAVIDAHKSKARVNLSSAQTISNETSTKIAFNTEDYDGLSEFDSTTNYTFTATNAGYYLAILSVEYESPVADKVILVGISKNGVTTIADASNHTSSTSSCWVICSEVASLAANDYIYGFTYHNCGGDETIAPATAKTRMIVHRLS